MNVLIAALLGIISGIGSTISESNERVELSIYYLSGGEKLTLVKPALASIVDGQNSLTRALSFQLSVVDTRNFADFTERHIGEVVEIFVCDYLVSSPVIQVRIDSRNGQIENIGDNPVVLAFLENGCP